MARAQASHLCAIAACAAGRLVRALAHRGVTARLKRVRERARQK